MNARAWLPHALLGAWLVGVAALTPGDRDAHDALVEQAVHGTGAAHRRAWFALAQRLDAPALAALRPLELLAAPDARDRELAFTNALTRHGLAPALEARLAAILDANERTRATLWLECRTTTPRRITLADLDRWFAAPPR